LSCARRDFAADAEEVLLVGAAVAARLVKTLLEFNGANAEFLIRMLQPG
jgi:hypothetical protein